MGQYKTTRAENPEWKLDRPQLTWSRRSRVHQRKSICLSRILDANYKNADLEQEVNKLIHLTKFQRVILFSCLKRYEDIFDVNLGEWTGPLVEIHIKEEAKPYHARAFPILVICIESFKKYLDRLVAIGVLTKINRSEWAAPSFIIPKKDV